MRLISAEDIFGRKNFESHSEFHLALYIAKALNMYDYTLDMSMMEIDKSILPKSAFSHFKNLLIDGVIFIDGMNVGLLDKTESNAEIDMSYFSEIEVYNVTPEEAVWSFDWAKDNYNKYHSKFNIFAKLSYSVMGVVSYFIVRKLLGIEKAPRLRIKIGLDKSRNTFIYSSIYSCQKSLDWFASLILLDINYSGRNDVDLDYEVFCNNSYVSHKYKYYNIREKKDFLDKLGYVQGSILIFWERQGMCENNIFGRIKSATVIRVDEIGDDFLGFTTISLNKTKEEVYEEYMDISEDIRHLFSDIPTKKPVLLANTRHLTNFGIGEYFYEELYLITKIDKRERVVKLVTIEGEKKEVEMSAVDAIYWLLCQYDIEFDKDLYRSMYTKNGETLLWDLYN